MAEPVESSSPPDTGLIRRVRRLLHPIRKFYVDRIRAFDCVDFVRTVGLAFRGYRPLNTNKDFGRFCIYVGKAKGRKVVLKILAHKYPEGRQLRKELKDPERFGEYRDIFTSLDRFPYLSEHICELIRLDRSGDYVCEHVAGPNLLTVQREIEAGTSPLSNDRELAGKILAATRVIIARMEDYNREYGCVRGDWPPGNLIYDADRDRLINIDLEGFYSYRHPVPGGVNDLAFIMGRMKPVLDSLESVC